MPLILPVLWLSVLWVSAAGEGSENQPAIQDYPAPYIQWLEEVRAQRRAWEAEREEARKARRRWIDPWGAEKREAMERDAEQRREAAKNFAEQQRESRRNPSIWRYPYGGYTPFESPADWPRPEENDIGPAPSQTDNPAGTNYPPGWNNPWFYRGY
jgi:hypothetical protein